MGIGYSVRYHPQVSSDLSKLSQELNERVRKAIESKLLDRPEIFGAPLREALKGHRKLRVGDLRIIFRIETDRIIILGIMHRAVVYKEILKRL